MKSNPQCWTCSWLARAVTALVVAMVALPLGAGAGSDDGSETVAIDLTPLRLDFASPAAEGPEMSETLTLPKTAGSSFVSVSISAT